MTPQKTFFLEFPNFITTARKYLWKYELWWKFEINWEKDGWDWPVEYTNIAIHFLEFVFLPGQKEKLQWMFGVSLRSYLSKFLLNFCRIFTIICICESSFWILWHDFKKCKKMFCDVISLVLYLLNIVPCVCIRY